MLNTTILNSKHIKDIKARLLQQLSYALKEDYASLSTQPRAQYWDQNFRPVDPEGG